MTRVADDKKEQREELGDLAVQQWELFRRVKEGTLLSELILFGIKTLINNQHPIGLKHHYDEGGMTFTLTRYTLGDVGSLLKSDGTKVKQVTFSNSEWIQARESGRNLLLEKGLRIATIPEAVGYVLQQKRPDNQTKWGVVSWKPTEHDFHWMISFEGYKNEVKVLVAQLNWEYLSGWKVNCPVLVVKL